MVATKAKFLPFRSFFAFSDSSTKSGPSRRGGEITVSPTCPPPTLINENRLELSVIARPEEGLVGKLSGDHRLERRPYERPLEREASRGLPLRHVRGRAARDRHKPCDPAHGGGSLWNRRREVLDGRSLRHRLRVVRRAQYGNLSLRLSPGDVRVRGMHGWAD